MLNLRQVQCFVLAVEHGTMTAAAQRLLVSQSAISLAISGLERDLGTQLLLRQRSRGLALTAAGQRFLPQARELLARAEELRADTQAQGGELTGSLTVGCFRTAAPFILPGLLETFAERHPQVALDFIEGPLPELERALHEGRCELALVYDLQVGPGIVCEALYEADAYVLLSPAHPLARRFGPQDAVPLRALAEHDLVLLDVPPSGAHITGVFEQQGVIPRVRYRISSMELLRSLVARNLGYALVISHPRSDVSYEGLPLESRVLQGPVRSTRFSIAWNADARRTLRARAFAEHCREMIPARLYTGAHGAR